MTNHASTNGQNTNFPDEQPPETHTETAKTTPTEEQPPASETHTQTAKTTPTEQPPATWANLPQRILSKIINFIKKAWQRFRDILGWFAGWLRSKLLYMILLTFILIIIVIFFWQRIFIVVNAGEGGVLYRLFTTGTVTDKVYTEGLHILNPFNNMTIYNGRVQIIIHELEVLTENGLPIHLRLAIRFRPIYELLGMLHKDVGPDYPYKIILPQIESVLRKEIGEHSPETVYRNEDGILDQIVTQAIEEVGQKFVVMDEIIIRTVTLPPAIKAAIDQKLVYEQQVFAYDYILEREEKEKERKKIEAEGIQRYQAIIAKTLNNKILEWHGVQATLELAKSQNSKVVVIGSTEDGLPLILNLPADKIDLPSSPANDTTSPTTSSNTSSLTDIPANLPSQSLPSETLPTAAAKTEQTLPKSPKEPPSPPNPPVEKVPPRPSAS